MTTITEKTFYKQLTASYSGGVAATVIGGVIVGGSAVFCGTQLGWTNLLTIILLAVLAACTALLLFLIIKMATVKNHPVFKKYGSAERLAEKINDGLKSPRYFARPLLGNAPFATLITDDFIVSGGNLVNYMELRDLVSVKASGFRDVHFVNISNPLTIGASIAADKIGQDYLKSKGINSMTQFDQLIMKDSSGKEHYYGVQHKDLETVLRTLLQIAPHIKLV